MNKFPKAPDFDPVVFYCSLLMVAVGIAGVITLV